MKRGKRSELAPDFLDQIVVAFEERNLDVLALHESLERLAEVDESLAHLVELRFFGGLTVEEVAKIEGKSVAEIKGIWRLARAWLRRDLADLRESDA